jgi:hypothetical protein
MKDSDIWSHSYRMYLIGENSISYPWYMPKNFPSDALDNMPKDTLLQFIKKEQWTMDWSACQRQQYYLSRLVFPYASSIMHRVTRRKHFKDLTAHLYDAFEPEFWEDQSGKTVRISCDQKYS